MEQNILVFWPESGCAGLYRLRPGLVVADRSRDVDGCQLIVQGTALLLHSWAVRAVKDVYVLLYVLVPLAECRDVLRTST